MATYKQELTKARKLTKEAGILASQAHLAALDARNLTVNPAQREQYRDVLASLGRAINELVDAHELLEDAQ